MKKKYSVTSKDISNALNKDGFEINKNQISLNKSIKYLTYEEIQIKLHPEVFVNVILNVARTLEAAEKQKALDFETALKTIGRFSIKKQPGEDGVLFGTVTNGDVAEAIQLATQKEIDRRHIIVPEIHGTGKYKVKIKLHSEVTAEINLEVIGN